MNSPQRWLVKAPVLALPAFGGFYMGSPSTGLIKGSAEAERCSEAMKEWLSQIVEHPASQRHFIKQELCALIDEEGFLVLSCRRCHKGFSGCRCRPALELRRDRFSVDCFRDPTLRPIFDQLGLKVQEE